MDIFLVVIISPNGKTTSILDLDHHQIAQDSTKINFPLAYRSRSFFSLTRTHGRRYAMSRHTDGVWNTP
jgi:hypothetical protein